MIKFRNGAVISSNQPNSSVGILTKLLLACLALGSAQAATYTVTNTNDSGAGSLRQALTDAQGTSGVVDTIDFDAGLSGGTIILTDTLGTADADGVTIDATVLANGLTIQQTGVNKRVILNTGILTLRGLTLTGAAATGGSGGGAVYSSGTLELDRCTLTGNSADFGGGALFNDGTTTIKRSTLHTNSTAGNGGAIYNNSGTLTLENCTISGNTSTGDYSIYNNAILILLHCTVAANPAEPVTFLSIPPRPRSHQRQSQSQAWRGLRHNT